MRQELSAAKVAIYARYSTDKQSDSSIDDQVAKCRAFVAARGGTVPDGLVFSDAAVSGARLTRPGFERLMAAVERGEVTVIVAEDLTRISRRMADSAMWMEEIHFRGVSMLGVDDGVNTADESASLNVGMRSVMAQQYIEDVRKRTHRGLTGIARRGHATGKLPLGYASRPTATGEREIVIDDAKAEIVRCIFALRTDGKSLDAIAHALNATQTPPPHGNGTRKREGWVASAVRAILRNEKYLGRWTWNERKYVKPPNSDKRVARKRDAADVIRLDRPDLRIVDEDTWNAVRAMERPRAGTGTGTNASAPGDARGRRPKHLLSGFLACTSCSGPMIVSGGAEGRRYYTCDAAKKRGTCSNTSYVREPIARETILADVRKATASPAAAAEIRRLYAEYVGDATRAASVELRKRKARLVETERRVQGLILMEADARAKGERSDFVEATRRDLEQHARNEREAIEAAENTIRGPVRLPTLAEVETAMRDVGALLDADVDVDGGREALRRLLAGQRIRIEPDGHGGHVARYELYPLAALFGAPMETPPFPGAAWSKRDCGGTLPGLYHAIKLARVVRIPSRTEAPV